MSNTGTTSICSADALTNSYALMEDDLLAQDGTNKWFWLYDETQTTLEITYKTGTAETSNYVEFYIEFGSGSVGGAPDRTSTMTWTRETVEYIDDSANQIVLEPWTYKIDGAAAATEYTARIPLPVCTKAIRIYAKEVGVAANYGTLTIKANTRSIGGNFYNRSLQTVTLEASGITIGDVRITDGTDIALVSGTGGLRADIAEVSGAAISATNPVFAELTDGTAAVSAANPLNVIIGDGTTQATVLARTTGAETPAVTDDALVVYDVAPGSSGGSGGGGATTYLAKPAGAANADAVVAYTAATQITVSELPFTLTAEDISSIRQIPNAGGAGAQDTVFTDVADFTVAAGVITVAGATFAATDSFIVTIVAQVKGYNSASSSNRVQEVNPINLVPVETSLADTTDVAAAATYYPSATGGSMLGFKHLSLTGKYVDAHAVTTTLSVQGTNDEDTTNASWLNVQGQVNGLASATAAIPTLTGTVAGATGQTVTVGTVCDLITTAIAQTVKFTWDFDDFNYAHYRVVLTPGDATNTVELKARQSY